MDQEETNDVEAGGNAMRRPPEVGLVVLSCWCCGVSGCAGVSQRLSLVLAGADRFGRGRSARAQPIRVVAPADRAAGSTDRVGAELAGNRQSRLPRPAASQLPGMSGRSRKSEWLARHFPSSAGSGMETPLDSRRDGVDPSVRSQASRVSARSACDPRPIDRAG